MGSLATRIHEALPQTQCTRCGYPDCAGYAAAIEQGRADINQCPPGGAEGVERLARITGLPVRSLNPDFGFAGPRAMAVVDEAWCIGCTLCLDACPTDAIVGIHKRIHTVLEVHCTGCELCIPVCPVDCISLEDAAPGRVGWQAWSVDQANPALLRYQLHSEQSGQSKRTPLEASNDLGVANADRKREIVEAALSRARAARQPKGEI